MRLPARLAVAVLVGALSAAPASAQFGSSTAAFFGPNGLTGRWGATGCTYAVGGQFACLDVIVETGIEAATGVGAVRYGVSGVRTFAFDFPGSGIFESSSQPNNVYGSALTTTGGSHRERSILTALWSGSQVRRNNSPLDNYDGTMRFETFRPGEFEVNAFFRYVEPVPRRSGDTGCPYFEPQSAYSCHLAQYDATYIHGTFTSLLTPEPSTWALLGTGLLTLGGIAARRRTRVDA
jgi:hypothetical protein